MTKEELLLKSLENKCSKMLVFLKQATSRDPNELGVILHPTDKSISANITHSFLELTAMMELVQNAGLIERYSILVADIIGEVQQSWNTAYETNDLNTLFEPFDPLNDGVRLLTGLEKSLHDMIKEEEIYGLITPESLHNVMVNFLSLQADNNVEIPFITPKNGIITTPSPTTQNLQAQGEPTIMNSQFLQLLHWQNLSADLTTTTNSNNESRPLIRVRTL